MQNKQVYTKLCIFMENRKFNLSPSLKDNAIESMAFVYKLPAFAFRK